MELELVLSRDPEQCYRAFCDVASYELWVPGLRKVRVVRSDPVGHALEVSYEFGEALSYALVYAWDDAARKVRWVPSAGAMDGVSGHARFAPHPDGCLFTYSLDGQRGRQPEHPDEVVRAFSAWLARSPRR